MFRVDAKFPPITMPTSSTAPMQIDSTLSAPLVFSPATVFPPVLKKPIWSTRPRIPKTTRKTPIRPAPIR